ncbi:hypothetical protein LCGC14_1353530 [marine sediment metagenome]|uniref:DUF1616 domain-containing protein n=1 Tax=marine sediment metagenome TaxID=412755 RepID=A0A0F9MQT6_9ZZZZ|nr:DUF1616 domain-containing protein [archaeon]
MDNPAIKVDKDKNLTSWKHFEALLKISLIIGIIIISGFIIYYVLTPEPGYITFGILNENQEAENYPTNATVGQNISFYITVENQMNREFSFRVEILKGDNKTVVSSSGSINATSYFNTTKISLLHNQFWMSEMLNISFSQPGDIQRIIVELWEIKNSGTEIFFNNLFIWLNILP